jgi:hypothetical protein
LLVVVAGQYLQLLLVLVRESAVLVVWAVVAVVARAITPIQRMLQVVLVVLELVRDKTVQLQHQAQEIKVVQAVLTLVAGVELQIELHSEAVLAAQA